MCIKHEPGERGSASNHEEPDLCRDGIISRVLFRLGRNFPSIHINFPPVRFASEKRKSGMCTTAASSTFRFRVPSTDKRSCTKWSGQLLSARASEREKSPPALRQRRQCSSAGANIPEDGEKVEGCNEFTEELRWTAANVLREGEDGQTKHKVRRDGSGEAPAT